MATLMHRSEIRILPRPGASLTTVCMVHRYHGYLSLGGRFVQMGEASCKAPILESADIEYSRSASHRWRRNTRPERFSG
jgi:hypothetical protein